MQAPGIQVRALTRFYGCGRASSRAVSFLFHKRVRYFFEEILYKNYRKTHIFELLICRDVEFTLCHIFRGSIVATRAPIVIPMAVTEWFPMLSRFYGKNSLDGDEWTDIDSVGRKRRRGANSSCWKAKDMKMRPGYVGVCEEGILIALSRRGAAGVCFFGGQKPTRQGF